MLDDDLLIKVVNAIMNSEPEELDLIRHRFGTNKKRKISTELPKKEESRRYLLIFTFIFLFLFSCSGYMDLMSMSLYLFDGGWQGHDLFLGGCFSFHQRACHDELDLILVCKN